MKNYNEIHLSDLVDSLKNTHVKLDLYFLNRLLQNASKSDKPHRNLKFAEAVGCPINKTKKAAMTIKGWLTGHRTVPMSKLIKIVELSAYSWSDIETNLISIKAGIRHGEIKPKFPIKTDNNLGSIIGYVLGDGSIDTRFHSLFFSNSNVELLKEFRGNICKIFGVEPRIWIQKRRRFEEKSEWLRKSKGLDYIPALHCVGLYYPKICSDILYFICGKFAEGKKKQITNEINIFNLDFKKGLIRAFFDSEGSVRCDSHTVRFHQDNKELLEDIRLMLMELGINPHEIKSYVKRNKLRYYFNVNGFKEYYKFYHNIGCTSSRKAREFELLISTVQNSKYFKKKFALTIDS